jgi:hypothetical protein
MWFFTVPSVMLSRSGGIRWRDDDLKHLLGSVPIPK